MSVFKLMSGDFGIDGMISSWPVSEINFPTSDDAWSEMARLYDAAETKAERMDIYLYWVEEHDLVTGKPVWVDEPYPQIHKPLPPDDLLRRIYQGCD